MPNSAQRAAPTGAATDGAVLHAPTAMTTVSPRTPTTTAALWIAGSAGIRLALRIASVAILARLLTPADYGIAASAALIFELAAVVYTAGLVPTLIQRKEVSTKHLATALTTCLLLSTLAAIAIFTCADVAARILKAPELSAVLRVLAVAVPVAAFVTICEAVLVRAGTPRSVALRPLVSFSVATFAVAIPLGLLGAGYWALVALQVVEVAVSALMLGVAARGLLTPPGFSKAAFLDLWPMSWAFALNQPFVYLADNIDRFLVARALGPATLGLYTRAAFLTTTVTNVFNNVARLSLFPAFARHQSEPARLSEAILRAVGTLAALALPISAATYVFAAELVSVLLGPVWSDVIVPFAVLSASMYFRVLWRLLAAVLQAIGRAHVLTILLVLRAGLLFGGVSFAVDRGLTAICLAVLVAVAANALIALLVVVRATQVPGRSVLRAHLHPLICSSLFVSVGQGLRRFGDVPSEFAVLVTAVISLSVVALLMRVSGALRSGPYGHVLSMISRRVRT